jgi:tryptophanyl-tRNA synthetase
MITETSKLSGLDGRKMSKSYNNSIYLDDDTETIWQKVRSAKTDTNRIKKTDKGNPEVCVVWEYHKLFTDKTTKDDIYNQCKAGTIGCMQCKKMCAKNIDEFISPIREKKASLSDKYIEEVLANSAKKANEIAKTKMEKINNLIF